MKQAVIIQAINVWPFINGSYVSAILILAGMSWLTYRRYRRARTRLMQAEKR